jgi:hypothetical protein
MREILSQRGFTEEEIPQLEQMEDFAEVRKRVEQAQAETLLAELETRSNARTETASEETDARIEADTRTLEERWTAFKTDVLAITKTPESETPPETLEDMRTRLETEAIERVDENIRSRVASIPVIWEWLADTLIEQRQSSLTPSEGIWGNIKNLFTLVIASFFGLRWVFKGLQDQVETARNAILPEVEVLEVSERDQDLRDVVEGGVENLSITNFRYNSWLNTLIFFSNGRNLENDSNVRNRIFDKIKDLSLNEVTSLRWNPERQVEVFWEELDRPWFREWLDILLPSFENAQFLEVCELSLWWNRIENILAPNGIENRRLFQILWEQRSREIIRLSNITWFELSSLTMGELSILYSASFPNLAYMRLASSMQLWTEIIDTTSEEFQEMLNNSSSWRILAYLATNGDGSSLLRDDSWFLGSIRESNPEISVKEIQAVIDFKNYVLSDDFQNHPSLRLSGETLTAFNNNLNYTRIILLYDILKWRTVEEVNSLNYPLLILAISSIIWWNAGYNIDNTGLAEAYKWEFMRNGIIDFFGRENITESERRAFEIYSSAFIYLGFQSWAERVYWLTQLWESITWISNENMFLWSSIAAFAWRRLLQSAHPAWGWILVWRATAWRYLMRAWWAGMIIYWGILWYEYFSGDESETERPIPDLPTRNDTDYIGHQIDRDLERAEDPGEQMQVLWRLRENTHEYMIGHEPITVITYPGDVPHAVYQGRIWTFQTLDGDNLAGDIEWYLINTIRWIGMDEELHNDSVWTDGERISIGASANTAFSFSLNELFVENNRTMWIETVRDLWGAIRSFMDEQFPWHGYTWGEELWQYIAVIPLPWDENKFLWLVAAPVAQQNSLTS